MINSLVAATPARRTGAQGGRNDADTRQHAHELVDQLGPGQLAAVVRLLKVMIDDEEDALTEEDREAIRSSRQYFRENPDGGLSFEEMVTGCGFAMDQVRKAD